MPGWKHGQMDASEDGYVEGSVGGWCVQGGLWGLANSVMGSMAQRLEGHQAGTACKPPSARCATTSHLYAITPVASPGIAAGLWVQTASLFHDLCVRKPFV